MSFVEKPDRVGRTLLISVALWTAVALVVLGILALALPAHVNAVATVSQCKGLQLLGDFAPAGSDLATPIMTAASRCGSAPATTDARELLHAYLEGAELDGTPHAPSPTTDEPFKARGAELYKQHCASCHGSVGEGAGPDACALETAPNIHKAGVYTLRTTEHEALPTDADLFRTITRGVHGTAMPPWLLLPDADRWALVAHVKSLSKQFQEDVAPAPVDAGTPPAATPARLEAGRALYAKSGCTSCHGERGHGDGVASEMLQVRPRDFTSGRFHRGSSAADIHETLVTGFDGTPMASFAKVMSDDDMWSVSLYVHGMTPPMTDEDGVRCPVTPLAISAQELLGVRSMMRSTPARP